MNDPIDRADRTASFQQFVEIEMRVGTVISAQLHPRARTPACVLDIDFGPELGKKRTSAQICGNYAPSDLVGRQVVAVVNLPPKRVAGIVSEVLLLAGVCKDEGTVLLAVERPVLDGTRIL